MKSCRRYCVNVIFSIAIVSSGLQMEGKQGWGDWGRWLLAFTGSLYGG